MLSPVLLAGRQRRGGAEAQRGELPQLALAQQELPQLALALTQLPQLALAHCGAAGDGSAEGEDYYRESQPETATLQWRQSSWRQATSSSSGAGPENRWNSMFGLEVSRRPGSWQRLRSLL